MAGQAEVARGRDAARRLAWADAYAALTAAGRALALSPDDLELLATSALLVGRVEEGLAALQHAHDLHAGAGDRRRAARCAFWLGFHLATRRSPAQAGGWFVRASLLLTEEPEDCAERGYLLLPEAIRHMDADASTAEALAARAAGIGRGAGDADLTVLGLHVRGRALVRLDRTREAMASFDEAIVAVVVGELSPIVVGTVYCSALEACQEVMEWRRAHEWTEALAAWCGKQTDAVPYSGKCLVHRAELLQLRGAWREAAQEARRAGERLADAGDDHATGAASYREAEAHRLLGDLAAAEEGYKRAARLGFEPHPGLALLRLAQGRTEEAAAAVERALGEAAGRPGRARLLPSQVEIMVAAGALERARAGADELADIAGAYGTPALEAVAGYAHGVVSLAESDARGAVRALRAAWRAWHELGARYEAARARVMLGLGCRALGDEEAAALELEAARAELEALGAATDLAHVERLARRAGRASHGLTPRELDVLRLLADGKTNRAIAGELVLASKTIDRHVSNIFAKLGVSSRAAATAIAYRDRLL
jgi:DNA-binding NarL/FixJ family response regulator